MAVYNISSPCCLLVKCRFVQYTPSSTDNLFQLFISFETAVIYAYDFAPHKDMHNRHIINSKLSLGVNVSENDCLWPCHKLENCYMVCPSDSLLGKWDSLQHPSNSKYSSSDDRKRWRDEMSCFHFGCTLVFLVHQIASIRLLSISGFGAAFLRGSCWYSDSIVLSYLQCEAAHVASLAVSGEWPSGRRGVQAA